MGKRMLSLFGILVLVLSIPVSAAQVRAISTTPSLSFDGTQANCTVSIYANNSSEKISAIVKLWNGSTCLKTWSASGTGSLSFYQTATVKKGQTYKLEVSYSVTDETRFCMYSGKFFTGREKRFCH